MCGRYSWVQKKKFPKLKKLKLPDPPLSISHNRAPGQKHPIIVKSKGNSIWSMAKWGIIPECKMSIHTLNPINARIETVREKSIFKNSLLFRRCLVPADGYFEWQKIETNKYPHFHFRSDRDTFMMAGIWNETIKGEHSIGSFSILTQNASSNLLHIHNRMPVIIKLEDCEDWLYSEDKLNSMLKFYSEPQQTLEVHQVSSKVNNPEINGPELISKFTERQSTLW